MKKLSLTTIIIVLALLGLGGMVFYRVVPKTPDDAKILAGVKEQLSSKQIEQKDEYYKAIGERIKELKDNKTDNDTNALVYIAVFYNNLGQKDLALDYYTRALAQNPTNRMGLDNLAHLYEDRQQWEKAEETYLKLLAAYPDNINGYRSLAYLYQYHFPNGETKILKIFEKGLGVTNNNADLLSWLIQYYQDTARPEKAVPFSQVLAAQLNAAGKSGAPKTEGSPMRVEVK